MVRTAKVFIVIVWLQRTESIEMNESEVERLRRSWQRPENVQYKRVTWVEVGWRKQAASEGDGEERYLFEVRCYMGKGCGS